MSVDQFQEKITAIIDRIFQTQKDTIRRAAETMAESTARGGLVHLFGSGHSVLPVQDVFPRYGSYPVFRPLMDARLMWQNVLGSGGAKGLLWLERREGYAQVLFENEPIRSGDVMVVFSHGGSNAVGVEVAKESRARGLKVVAITSAHGKKLAAEADIVIDNCTPPEDALVQVDDWYAPVAAGSTIAFITIAQSLVAEVASQLAKRGIKQPVFVSPNVPNIPAENNWHVFAAYEKAIKR